MCVFQMLDEFGLLLCCVMVVTLVPLDEGNSNVENLLNFLADESGMGSTGLYVVELEAISQRKGKRLLDF